MSNLFTQIAKELEFGLYTSMFEIKYYICLNVHVQAYPIHA